MVVAVNWLLPAIQSSDADVSSHALLATWKSVHDASRSKNAADRDELSRCFVEMDSRKWRRLGLLLFASDVTCVRAVTSLMVTLAVNPKGGGGHSHGDGDDYGSCAWQRPVRRRLWTTDWRQFLIDKLIDCHARAIAASGVDADKAAQPDRIDVEISIRLLFVLQSCFTDAVGMGLATPNQQVQVVDLLIDVALSPVESLACQALQILLTWIHPSESEAVAGVLDEDVRGYLDASRLCVELLNMLTSSFSSPPPPAAQSKSVTTSTRPVSYRHRHLHLAFAVLIRTVQQSKDAALAIAQDTGALLELVLGIVENAHSHEDHQAHAIQLLGAIMQHGTLQAATLASTIRLGGALISLSWLLGHVCEAVRTATHDLFAAITRVSPPTDLVRALVEQGCVVILYLCLPSESTNLAIQPCRERLQWVIGHLDSSDQQLTQSLALSATRSTNTKLQRNILLSLLLLSQSSPAIFHTLNSDNSDSFLHSVVGEAIRAHEHDTSLATALISVALLCGDKSSALKLDAHVNATSLRKLPLVAAPPEDNSNGPVNATLLCGGGVGVDVSDEEMLSHHCKRLPPLSSPQQAASMSFDLRSFHCSTVELLLELLPMSPPQAARELKRYDRNAVVGLLHLAKTLDCAKCWHAATLTISESLDGTNWKSTLDVAVTLRHPRLMYRCLRMALTTSTTPGQCAQNAADIKEAALMIWQELVPPEGLNNAVVV